MPGKNDTNRFSADLVDHTAFAGFFRQQANRPPRPPLWRRSAYQRHQRRLLRAIEHRARLRPWLVGQSLRQPALQIALSQSGYFPVIAANRHSRCSDAVSTVEK
jgi:hypothetical protein